MIYLTINDLKTHSFAQYIDESSADFTEARDNSELQNIDKIKGKLSGRFDVDAIFSNTSSRPALIVRVLTLLVIYDVISRNKARKVPEDLKELKKEADTWLDNVRDYIENPTGLPALTDEGGNVVNQPITGNNSNSNFYI